jgi:hypothetical protein
VFGSRGGAAIIGGIVALAVAAAPAYATSDRADYDAQVNPICASANAQVKQLYDQLEALLDKLPDSGSGTTVITDKGKSKKQRKRSKQEREANRLFNQLPFQIKAIYDAELAQLKQVAPAAGDESLVANWLGNRQAIQDLNAQFNALEQRIERLFTREFKRRRFNLKAFERSERKQKRLEAQATALYEQLEQAENKDVEFGTQLGATYCVTQATGTP